MSDSQHPPCVQCGHSYETNKPWQRFCCVACKTASLRKGTKKGPNAGTKHTPEHVAKRMASLAQTLASTSRPCALCGNSFTPLRAAQRYCSGSCAEKVRRSKKYVQQAGNQSRRPAVTPLAFALRLEEQNGVCAICHGVNASGYKLCIDHVHGTGEVRGLLCHRCNTAIGLFHDDPDVAASAVRYLTK